MKSESSASKSLRSRPSAARPGIRSSTPTEPISTPGPVASASSAGATKKPSRAAPEPAAPEPAAPEPAAPEPAAPEPAGWRWATVVCEPAAVYEVEAEPVVSWPWEDELEGAAYSIRIPESSGAVKCARCRIQFSAAGPTGFAEDRPVCDMCLLEGSSELGMMMALVAVVRAFGSVRPSDHREYREALGELGAFSRIYDRYAAKSGPPRIFRIPSFEVEL